MTIPRTSATCGTDRLELHAQTFASLDMTGPLLRFADLNVDERTAVLLDFMRVGSQAFHVWGVMCPHPPTDRSYEGFWRSEGPVAFEDATWFECSLCRTRVINRGT